jgi:hypothetical protein
MQHARFKPTAPRGGLPVQRPDFGGRACWFRQPEGHQRPESEQNMGKGRKPRLTLRPYQVSTGCQYSRDPQPDFTQSVISGMKDQQD